MTNSNVKSASELIFEAFFFIFIKLIIIYMNTLIIIYLLFSTSILISQEKEVLEPKLKNISWISGNWKGEAFEE